MERVTVGQLLKRYLWPQRLFAMVMALLLVLNIGLHLAGPQVMRAFISGVSDGLAEGALLRLAALAIALSLLAKAAKALSQYASEQVAWTASNGLRLDLARHLLRLDGSFHKEHRPGEWIERVDGDVGTLAGLLSSMIIQVLGSLLLVMGILVSLLLVSLPLGLAFAAFALGSGALLARVQWLATPYYQEARERSAQFYGYMGEVLAASEELRTSAALPYALSGFTARLQGWMALLVRANGWGSLPWVCMLGAIAVADGIAYGLGGALFRQGAIQLGALYMVVAYTAMLAEPLEMLRVQLAGLQQAKASLARVQELLAIAPKVVGGDRALPEGPLAVSFRSVSFRYDEEAYVVDGLSFKLEPGRRLGLLGRTGSGKTTIARLLARLYDPTEGRLEVGGVDLAEVSLKSLRARVGLVTQDVQLFAATLRENVTLFDPTIPDERLLAIFDQLALKAWFEALPHGLDTVISPSGLSAGEGQLLAFARLFLADPGLVILDEASSRLDPATEALLGGALQRLLAGRTAIMIAHRLATVEEVDEIMLLEGGRVLEHGGRQALLGNPGSHFAQLRAMGLEEVLQ